MADRVPRSVNVRVAELVKCNRRPFDSLRLAQDDSSCGKESAPKRGSFDSLRLAQDYSISGIS